MNAATWFRLLLPFAAGLMLSAARPLSAPPPEVRSASPDLCRLARTLADARLIALCGNIRHLGHGTFTGLGLIVPGTLNVLAPIDTAAEGRRELAEPRHFFEYDRFVVTVRSDSVHHLDMVLRTAAILERIRLTRPEGYRFLTSMLMYPTAPSMTATPWKNRFERIFISFDRTPKEIAAGGTVLNRHAAENGVDLYRNYAILSVDEVTIRGATQLVGSLPIYGLPSAAENYRAYMADGLMYTLLHEAAHRYVDHLNSTSLLANALYNARPNATSAEEIVANETAMSLVDDVISPEMRRHVMDLNTGFAAQAGVRASLAQWRALAGTSRTRLVVPD